MREFTTFVLNGLGSIAATLVLTFIVFKAFGAPLVYNEALGVLTVIGATWVVLAGNKIRC